MVLDTLKNLEQEALKLPSKERLSFLSNLARLEEEIESKASKTSRGHSTPAQDPTITTVPLAAKYFGVTTKTIRDWIDEGVLEKRQKRVGAKVFVVIPPNLILTKKQLEE